MAACLYLYEAVQTVSLCCILIASLVFSACLFGHTLRFGSIRLSSISDFTYCYYSHISISSSCVRVSLHIPRRSNPRWATLTVYDYEFKDSECHVSFTKVHVTFWFFPFLLRFTAGPLASVELHDFRLRVFSSKATPGWVEFLRRNLITTVLTGEMIRLDDFKTKVTFSTITGATDGFSGPVEKPGVPHGEEQDEIRVSASWEQWHILNNWQGRMYTFGKLDAQLRKSWVEERGSFVMIAEECRWTKVSSFVNRETFRNSYGWWYVVPLNMNDTICVIDNIL